MNSELNRRQFMQATAAGSVVLASSTILGFAANSVGSKIISPGCRGSKVKVARLFIAGTGPSYLWPKPNLNLDDEVRFYKTKFAEMQPDFNDIDWVVDRLITSPRQLGPLKDKIEQADGVLVIQQGAVCQVEMRPGQKVTQAKLIGTDLMLYFTGQITKTLVSLKDDRGCRTKIAVKVDGDITKLWRNWSNGLHRVTCYGDLTTELGYFCKFKNINLVNEAV